MKEFALLFRMDVTTEEAQPTSEQMEQYMTEWMEWIEDIAHQGHLAEGGNHFSRAGRVIEPGDRITNTPHTAAHQSLAGYILISASDWNEATEIAKKCPILNGTGTSVEIREVASPGIE